MKSFLQGFLLGFVVAMVAGILLAPRPGSESQSLVRQRALEALESGRQAAQAHEARLRERFREMTGTAEEA